MKTEEYRCEIDYDDDFDFLLFKRPGFKSSGAVKAGDFTIDFYKNELVGIEIEGASRLFQTLFGQKIDFSKVTKAKIGFKEEGNVLLLFFAMHYNNAEIRKDVLLPKIEPIPILA